MAIIQKEKYTFKKGQIIHIDHFLEVSAFVQVDGRTEPYRSKHLTHWDADTSDEHKVLKHFVVEVVVRGGKK